MITTEKHTITRIRVDFGNIPAYNCWGNPYMGKVLGDTMSIWDMHAFYGKGVITNEVFFKRIKRSDVPEEIEHPLWLLEVSNADTNEVVARNCFETPGAMLTWADEQILDWRYTEAGIVNHTFRANGVDITKHFYAKDRKRYTLSVGSWDKKRIHIMWIHMQIPTITRRLHMRTL